MRRIDAHPMSEMASAYLDALRAVGANLVIVAHASTLYFGVHPFRAGHLGVALFFLLSGFLIMQSMLNWLQKPEPRFAGFVADRVARIMTPYVPALVLIALVNMALIGTNHNSESDTNTGVLQFIGNFLLLQDHAVFQGLELAGIDLAWRIRSYNSAEPFWTVAIEMWIYVFMGLFVFCVVRRERIDRWLGALLAAIALPVVIWNAAAGGGTSLTLIWLLGAMAGYLFNAWRAAGYANLRSIGMVLMGFGTVALIGRVGKVGFQPYDFQTATLIALVMFGLLALLMHVQRVPGALRGSVKFLASYSYSLYLLHNTVLIVVLENVSAGSTWQHVAIAVVAAHVCSYLLYAAFERHYRVVGRWLRPRFERALAPRGSSQPSSAAADALAGGPTAVSRQER